MQGWISLTPLLCQEDRPCALPDEGRLKGNVFIRQAFLLSFPIKLHISAQGSFFLF